MRDMPSGSTNPVPPINPVPPTNTSASWEGGQPQHSQWGFAIALVIAMLLGYETYQKLQPPPFTRVEIEQAWELEPGDRLGRYRISSGLGDVVIELGGAPLYMPMAGEIQPISPACHLFSSPELPAYRLRLCGLTRAKSGPLSQGAILGRGDRVALALLRRQPQGTWAMVEPATSILEQFLTPPHP